MPAVDIGQITEALNDKTDRDNRNVDTVAGADAVIEYQMPSADNGYTWYRKYRSGWVEQGGVVGQQGASGTITINLPVEMADTNYMITAGVIYSTNASTDHREGASEYESKSTTSFNKYFWVKWTNYTWQVSGMAA